ncbi:uncharacterized protein LOC100216457 isoform X1 [Nasonia vitripennis]|uniref:MADF domain-containing protein n=1 Tax=Nasonia vitripennis TaxID=7425 RepID=A0A7M7INV9_NASVI|nr:uncharacterized protein LOC100216457 [Nasonia vitripennis]XP_016838719.1 uncharacterized protein LOC100216457 isoform X1 [Nasonia vitripennis]
MMSSNSPDSHKISLKIIEAIKQHPVLYISEVKATNFKVQEFRQKVWKRISDELGLDPGWVKLKWKNLRDTYCRILKYKNKSAKGERRKKWIFEDHLSFLKFPYEPNYEAQYVELTDEYIKDINTEIISAHDLIEQLEENDDDDDYSEYLEVLEEDTSMEESHIQESCIDNVDSNDNDNDNALPEASNDQTLERLAIDAYAKQIQSKFRKIRPKNSKLEESKQSNSITPIFINTPGVSVSLHKTKPIIPKIQPVKRIPKLHSQNSFDHKGSIDQFFNSIAQTVKKLPPKAQADIKMDICKIVSEAELNHLRQNHVQNLQKYTKMPGMIPKLVLVPCQLLDNENHKV